MEQPIELEVELTRAGGNQYRAGVRIIDPREDQLPDTRTGELTIDIDRLAKLEAESDLRTYSQELTLVFFDGSNGLIRNEFRNARIAAAPSRKLRLRLLIDEGSEALNTVLWETLRDPESEAGAPLCADPTIFFSRALKRGQSRQYTLRRKYQARVLVVISNPAPRSGVMIAHRIDTDLEKKRAETGFAHLVVKTLITTPGQPGETSLDRVIRELDDAYDVLYLVCHGSFDPKFPDTRLNLEDAAGQLDQVSGSQFVSRIGALASPPRLFILCSCQTSDTGAVRVGKSATELALMSLGPRLVRAGIPAVLAMQGNLLMDTAAIFFKEMLENLMEYGTIDAAVSYARSQVASRSDYYVPVLYQRIRSGRLWYGATDVGWGDEINWKGLLKDIENASGVLVLGSALLDPYIGAQSEVAAQLAEAFNYPFADSERDDMALVGQYLASAIGKNSLQNEVLRQWMRQVIRDFAPLTNNAVLGVRTKEQLLRAPHPELELARMLSEAWKYRRVNETFEPHSVLAGLPFKAYISTNPDTLIEQALEELRRQGSDVTPVVWRCGTKLLPRRLPGFTERSQPTPQRPLIAYLYGTLEEPDSLVLSEEDYYEQLITAAEGEAPAIKFLDRIFTNSALIFLGFRLNEWDFRILFRRLKLIDGWVRNQNFNNVAVQVDPSTARGTASDATIKRYLGHLFAGSKIEIFRGSVEQFVKELSQRCNAAGIPRRQD